MVILPFPFFNATVDFNVSRDHEIVRDNNNGLHFFHFLHVPVYILATILTVTFYRRYRIQSRPLPPRPATSFERALADERHPINTDPLYITPNEP